MLIIITISWKYITDLNTLTKCVCVCVHEHACVCVCVCMHSWVHVCVYVLEILNKEKKDRA